MASLDDKIEQLARLGVVVRITHKFPMTPGVFCHKLTANGQTTHYGSENGLHEQLSRLIKQAEGEWRKKLAGLVNRLQELGCKCSTEDRVIVWIDGVELRYEIGEPLTDLEKLVQQKTRVSVDKWLLDKNDAIQEAFKLLKDAEAGLPSHTGTAVAIRALLRRDYAKY